MPKFKTPEEELTYLRAHVAKREQELIGKGRFEHAKDDAVRDIIEGYCKSLYGQWKSAATRCQNINPSWMGNDGRY